MSNLTKNSMNQHLDRYQARVEALKRLPRNLNDQEAYLWLKTQPNTDFTTYNSYTSFIRRQIKEAGLNPPQPKEIEKPVPIAVVSTPQQVEYNSPPPQSLEHGITGFTLPTGLNKVLILSDVHVPYHNIQALETAVNHGKRIGVDTVWLNGDALDFYSISRHEKDPNERDLKREVEMGREFFGWIRGMFPKAKIYWKIGNHEDRWDKYLMDNANDLHWVDELQLSKLLRIERLGVEIVSTEKIAKLGKLNLIHGHEFKGGGGGANVARWLFLRTGATAACGHFHRTSHNIERQLDGSIISCWTIGTLSELHPKWLPYNKWNLGFADVELEDNGMFMFNNKIIIDGKIH